MWYHILPNVLGIVIANFVLEVVLVVMLEAGLSFLGLGDPLNVSWGTMLYFSQTFGAFLAGAWWWWLPPGLCIALLGMAFSFIGNTLNDRFVLKLKSLGKG
jgi:peptide/nickel transport system permease protein